MAQVEAHAHSHSHALAGDANEGDGAHGRKSLLSLRRWMIIFILGALVALLKLKYEEEEIAALFKSHTILVKIFISILFLDFVTLYASHKPGIFQYHSALDKIGFLLDALLFIIGLLAIEPFLGWFFLLVWILSVIVMTYKLYKDYELQRSSVLPNSSGEEELEPRAGDSPREEEKEEEDLVEPVD